LGEAVQKVGAAMYQQEQPKDDEAPKTDEPVEGEVVDEEKKEEK
jgi:hypothetical protein